MRWLVKILEWLVLLPLWRSIFKPKVIQGFFAAGTALVWLIVIIVVAAPAGGGGGDCGETAAGGGGGDGAETAIRERIVAAVPGAVAEAEGVRITLNEIADPFVSIGFFATEPHQGRRFVAFDVTIEWTKDIGSHYTSLFSFTLSGADDFAYERDFLAQLAVGKRSLQGIYLCSGQETRGWIAFQVAAHTPLRLLKYDPDWFTANNLTTNDIEFHFAGGEGTPEESE